MDGPTTAAHVSRYAPHSTMAPHRHGEAWLSLILRGGYEECICARRQAAKPGDLLFYPAHAEHSQCFGAQGAQQILLSPDVDAIEYLAGHAIALEEAPHRHGAIEALAVGTRLQRELAAADVFSGLAIAGLSLELVALLGRDDASRSAPSWLRRIKDRLDCADDLPTLPELARDANRHPVHVAREFRRHYGRTLGDYLRRLRSERAARLMRTTAMPLTEIALACGYAGSSQLSRAFRAAFGLAPSEYRRIAR
ncbi:MAG: AraC family transcriptional regulator [Rhodanobacteraceae bacterium]